MSATKPLLSYALLGNKNSKNMLIFLHGFPDDTSIWKTMTEKLLDYYIVLISYPNFDPSIKMKWGLSFEEIRDRLYNTIEYVDEGFKRRKIAVAHDWGCFHGYLFDEKYPNYLDDMMTLDVGLGVQKSFKGITFILFYQLFLTFAFLIGGFIGKIITRIVFWIIKGNYKPKNYDLIDSSYNYFYYYLWKNMIFGKCLRKKPLLQGYKPSCNLAYVFARNKPCLFHSEKFILQLSEREKCEVHAVKGGHWIMLAHSDMLVEIIKRRNP